MVFEIILKDLQCVLVGLEKQNFEQFFSQSTSLYNFKVVNMLSISLQS